MFRPLPSSLMGCHLLSTLSLTRHLSPAGESLSKGTAYGGSHKRLPLGGAGCERSEQTDEG